MSKSVMCWLYLVMSCSWSGMHRLEYLMGLFRFLMDIMAVVLCYRLLFRFNVDWDLFLSIQCWLGSIDLSVMVYYYNDFLFFLYRYNGNEGIDAAWRRLFRLIVYAPPWIFLMRLIGVLYVFLHIEAVINNIDLLDWISIGFARMGSMFLCLLIYYWEMSLFSIEMHGEM